MALVDLLDRLLDGGAVVLGDAVLTVADVELVYVGLRAVLGAADSVMPALPHPPRHALGTVGAEPQTTERPVETTRLGATVAPTPREVAPRLELPDDDVAGGLVRLVLSVVELLRELMERRAIARMEAGGLSASQVDRLGRAMARLASRMAELQRAFALEDDDLTIRVGSIAT